LADPAGRPSLHRGHRGSDSLSTKSRSNFVTRTWNGLFRHEDWNIGIVREPIAVFLRPNVQPRIDWLPPLQSGLYLADPFGIVQDGRTFVLCEEFDYRSLKGRIVGIELHQLDASASLGSAIDLPIHCSYPYLFEHEGQVYCVPETSQALEVSLYRAKQLPCDWVKIATLIRDFPASDSTVFEHDGYWWLACSVEWDDLFLWCAPDFLGPWRQHANNPVKKDIRSSRSAGTPFMHDGELYRPAQDCSRTYGGRIVLNRVKILTPTEFEEEEAGAIEPYSQGPYPDGLHTVSKVGDVTLVDGKRHVFIRSAFRSTLKRTLARYSTALA